MLKRFILFIPCLIIPSVISKPASAEQWIFNAAYEYETLEAEDGISTDIVSIPINLKLLMKNWGFGLSIPYVSISGSSTVVPSTGSASGSNGNGSGNGYGQGNGVGSGQTNSLNNNTTRSGFGDTTLWVSHLFSSNEASKTAHELIASTKLVTGDENKNLSSGAEDYTLELVTSYNKGRWFPGWSIGYQWTGDPEGADLRNTWFASAGSGYELDQNNKLGFRLHVAQSVDDTADDPLDISGHFTHIVNRWIDIGVGASMGLSDSSSDYSLAVSMTAYY